jgi:hypothetical protein
VKKLLARYQHQAIDPVQQVEAPYPGYLGCQDIYFADTLNGVRQVYAHTFIDAHRAAGFAKLYPSRMAGRYPPASNVRRSTTRLPANGIGPEGMRATRGKRRSQQQGRN